MECKCAITCSVSEVSFDKEEKAEPIVAECTTFDFGSTAFGNNVRKVFEIKNDTNKNLEYTVSRNPDSNPIYQCYDFHYTKLVPKKTNFKCIIWYKPTVAFWSNVDVLYIDDNNGKHYKLILKGKCLAPLIQVSSNELKYFANHKQPTASQTIELVNVGTIPAKFRFDVKNNAMGYFKINTTHGVIEVGRHLYVKISFEPKAYGIYFNDIYVLTLHMKPRRISLIGYYTPDEVNELEVTFKLYNIPVPCKTGFVGYLYDVIDLCETPPPFSLTNTSLDFGSIEIKTPGQTKTLVTSLTNHIDHSSITVIWDIDPKGYFEINPSQVVIPPNNSVLLECSFKPNKPDAFYDSIMSGRVFWIDPKAEKDLILVPMCIYLRLLGSSFPPNKAWIPQLSYPDKIIVQPALPNSISHDDFEMKVTGHLPVSYRFVAPKNSRFILKPSQGVIMDNEIIVIQFSAHELNDKGCMERWTLILNDREKHCHFIFISSYVEIPKILINKDNKIVFENVLPRCCDVQPVTLKNISVHYLMFRILVPDEEMLRFSQNEGGLASNEEITLEATATALQGGACHIHFTIELRKFATNILTGPPFLIKVKAKIKAIYGELCALPNFLDLGKIQVDQPVTSEFNLFNFGESRINFTLLVYPDEEKRLEKYIQFTPQKHDLQPGGSRRIIIAITCSENRSFEFYVCYKVRLNRNTNKMLDEPPKNLVKVVVNVQYASLQVVSITNYTHGECFSKPSLWKLLNINKFNNELREIRKGETRTIEMYLPDCEVSGEPFLTTLILQNQTIFNLEVDFKRNKICDCPLLPVDKSLTFRKNIYFCRHRRLFEATLSNTFFKPGDSNELKLTVRYEQPENVTMSYILQLPEQRTIILYFYFNILDAHINFPSRYHIGNILYLPPVALFERNSAYIPLYFYNQSLNTVRVGLNEKKPDQSRYDKDVEIMKCLNPNMMDITPYKMYPLLFQFQPIRYQKYTSLFNLILGDQEQKLNVSSMGLAGIISSEQSNYDMSTIKRRTPETDITFSLDYIKVVKLLTWSCTEVMIFIKNNTEDVIGFSMKRNCIDGVISIHALCAKGVLKPKEVRSIIIYIETFNVPLKINMNLIGKFLNHTQYFRHKKSQLEYHIKEELIQEEFTITEKGEQYMKNDVIVAPMPNNFFRSIMFQLTTISIFDVDLHMTAEEQLKQSPQFVLQLNEENILKSLVPEKFKDEFPVPTLARQSSQFNELGVYKRKLNRQNSQTKKPNKADFPNPILLKDTIECMLLTALESKMFRKSLDLHQQSDPPYYVQFRVFDDADYKNMYVNKMTAVKNELNGCQGPKIAAIFRNVLCEGLHQVMHLGPPSGYKREKEVVYDQKFKSQCTL